MSHDWILTVGMEVHIELDTKTKMFCGCLNDPFTSEVNANVCPVCYGLPGALPVANRKAIEQTILLGRALQGTIAKTTFWARKNYFYPDLPKGYQISQSTAPIVADAVVKIDGESHRIERIHLEEDAGKLSHTSSGTSLVDYNRAGVPLLEIVTKPDFHSANSAKRFCQELQRIVRHLEIATADMEKGQMRCEANISVSKDQALKGVKVEVKNINSFRAVERAIEYEFTRQVEDLEENRSVVQETRTWNDSEGKTVAMRIKETSADYRYFPEPDLPLVELTWTGDGAHLLPEDMRQQLRELGLKEALIEKMVDKGFYDLLIALEAKTSGIGSVAAGLLDKISGLSKLDIDTIHRIIVNEKISHGLSDLAIADLVSGIESGGTYQSLALDTADEAAIAAKVTQLFPEVVNQYKSGNEKVISKLLGEGRSLAQGRVNMTKLKEELEKLLN